MANQEGIEEGKMRKNQKIKEEEIEVVLVDMNRVSYETNKLSGFLEGFIFHTDSSFQIEVSIDGYRVYEEDLLSGDNYIPIRLNTIDKGGNRFNFGCDKWCMKNSKLRFVVSGLKGTKIKIGVRYG